MGSRKLTAAVLLAALLLALPVAALAEEVVVAITAGPRVAQPASADCGSFEVEWIDRNDNPCTANGGTIAPALGTWGVDDRSFDGAGSHLVVTLPDLSDGGPLLAASNVKVSVANPLTVVIGDAVGLPVSLITSAASQSPAGVTWISAAVGDGEGFYTFIPSFSIDIPAGQAPGNYSASFTAAYLSGP